MTSFRPSVEDMRRSTKRRWALRNADVGEIWCDPRFQASLEKQLEGFYVKGESLRAREEQSYLTGGPGRDTPTTGGGGGPARGPPGRPAPIHPKEINRAAR